MWFEHTWALISISILCGLARGFAAIGPAVIFVGCASQFLPIKDVIVISSAFDLVTALYATLMTKNGVRISLVEAILFFMGSLAGCCLFAWLSAREVNVVVAVIMAASIPILLINYLFKAKLLASSNPNLYFDSKLGGSTLVIAGLVGGITGMPGPIVALYLLTRTVDAVSVRNYLLPILLVGSVSRVLYYSVLEEYSVAHLQTLLILIPGSLAGVVMANSFKNKIPNGPLLLLLLGITFFSFFLKLLDLKLI